MALGSVNNASSVIFQPAFHDRVHYCGSPIKNLIEELLHLRGLGQLHVLTPLKGRAHIVTSRPENITFCDKAANVAKVIFYITLIVPIALLILRQIHRSLETVVVAAQIPPGDIVDLKQFKAEDVGLNRINNSPEFLMDMAIFPIHSEILLQDGSLQNVQNLAARIPMKQQILEAKLTPYYCMDVHGKIFYLSKLFSGQEISPSVHQMAAIAYIPDGLQKLRPTILYRSGDSNLWRAMPVITPMGGQSINYGKGPEDPANNEPIRAFTNVPMEVNFALEWMQAKSDDETLVNLHHSRRRLDEIFLNTPERGQPRTPNSSKTFDAAVNLNREDLDLYLMMSGLPFSPVDAPDFDAKISYEIPGIHSDKVKAYRVHSYNGDYEYLFYKARGMYRERNNGPASKHIQDADHSPWDGTRWKEKEEHVWLAAVYYKGKEQELTPFCTNKHVRNIEFADLSAADGKTYLPMKYQEDPKLLVEPGLLETNYVDVPGSANEVKNDPTIPPQTRIVPTWSFRKKLAIIKMAEKALK